MDDYTQYKVLKSKDGSEIKLKFDGPAWTSRVQGKTAYTFTNTGNGFKLKDNHSDNEFELDHCAFEALKLFIKLHHLANPNDEPEFVQIKTKKL